jgi:hypothetical protein
MLIVTSLLKPDAAALLPRQHHVRRPTPATALTPRKYRWRRRPRCDGSVGHVALASSSSAARLGSEYCIIFSSLFCKFFVRCFLEKVSKNTHLIHVVLSGPSQLVVHSKNHTKYHQLK